VREADATATGERRLLGRVAPFVGRQRELAMLRAAWDGCRRGEGAQAVIVIAPPGVGKSRLLAELLASLDGARAWIARGDPRRQGLSFELLAQALRPVDGGLVSGRCAPPVEEVDPAARADAVREAWLGFLAAELAAGPRLLVLEDLHWGDLASVKLVDAALRVHRDGPLLVVALARPEIDEVFPRIWADRSLHRLELRELPRRACEELVHHVLGGQIAPEVAARVAERSGGNAFFLEELIRAVATGQADELPATVVAMAQARLERLDPEARRVLRAASVFGETFWPGGVLALLGRDAAADRLARRLAQLEEAEVVERRGASRFPGEREWIFRHAFVREAAYATLVDEDRRAAHRLAADWLEGSGEQAAVLLGEHRELGGELARAAIWFARAARHTSATDPRGAIALADRAVACGASGELLGALRSLQMDMSIWSGQMRPALACAGEVRTLLPRTAAGWPEAAGTELWLAGVLGEREKMEESTRALLAHEPSARSAASFARGCGWAARTFSLTGDYAAAATFLARGEETVARHASAREDLRAQGWLDSARALLVLYQEGDPFWALALWRSGVEGLGAGGDRVRRGFIAGELAIALNALGAHAEARDAAVDARQRAAERGYEFSVCWMGLHGAVALLGLGEHERALEELTANAESWREFIPILVPACRTRIAEALALGGRFAEAEAEARWAEAQRMAIAHKIDARAVLSRLLLRRGAVGEALALARKAVEGLERLGGNGHWDTVARVPLAEALWASGARAEAWAALELAHVRLLERAARIPDEPGRERFLRVPPEHRRAGELVREWAVLRSRDGVG
jgi:tetratricopeptide (TPR) repeat protein